MRRGEIYYCLDQLTHGDVIWSEGRPCVIVSADEITESECGVVQVVFLTTQPKHVFPTHVKITSSGRESTVLCEQIVAIPKESLGARAGVCTPEDMRAIERGLLAGLGIAAGPARAEGDDQLLIARTERDTYKRMYEELLAKLLGVTA